MELDREGRERMKMSVKTSSRLFTFGDTNFASRCTMEIPVFIGGLRVFLKTEILKGDIPWLIGKDTMSRMDMKVHVKEKKAVIGDMEDTEIDLKEDRRGHLRISLIPQRKREEIWAEGWSGKNDMQISKTIRKLHLQFGHASGERIWKLTEDAGWGVGLGEERNLGLKNKVLKQISECEICVKYKKNPPKPVVGLSWGTKFNEAVSLDLGEFEGKRFMVMVDLVTKFCQAKWVKDKTPESIMNGLMEGWLSIFGPPSKILTDNGGEFQNEKVRIMYERWNIKMLTTPAESPWSNGLCERTVGLIKEGMRKMVEEENIKKEMALGWVVFAKNCLGSKGGFSPNQLVFGRNPVIPNLVDEEGVSVVSVERGQEEQLVRDNLNAMQKAREVNIKNESCTKIRTAMRKNVREHKIEDVIINDEVYYKREDEKQWRGPAKVIGVDGKVVVVKHGDSIRKIARVHITRIQGATLFRKEEEKRQDQIEVERNLDSLEEGMVMVRSHGQVNENEVDNNGQNEEDSGESEMEQEETEVEENRGEENMGVAAAIENNNVRRVEIPRLKKGDRVRAQHKETKEKEEWTVLGLAAKRNSKKWGDSYNVQEKNTGRKEWINLREYEDINKIEEGEEVLLGFEDDMVEKAKKKELNSWKENGVYDEVEDTGQKAVSTRWVVTEKIKDGEVICKARLVARGFEEELEGWEKDAPTCNAETLKFCLSIINQKGWMCCTVDIKTAYLQGDKIQREVYVKPPAEIENGVLWRLNKTVYGLQDAAKAWYKKVVSVVNELGGKKSKLEQNIFYWKDRNGDLVGILCVHVDDFCYGGSKNFQESVIEKMKNILKVGEQGREEFKYIGVNIKQGGKRIILEQKNYIENIQEPDGKLYQGIRVLKKNELTLYRSTVGSLNWAAQHVIPEISYDISDLSRSFKEGTTKDMKKLIKIVRKAKRSAGEISLDRLDENKMYWEIYADASFGNVEDEQTQIGYIISLTDDSGICPIWWKSRKARRVAKSTIEAEALGVGEAIEGGIYFNELWKEIVGGRKIDIRVRTDSKTLSKAIKSSTGVSSKRLKIDIAAIRETLERGEIKEIEWVPGKEQVADVLTKRGASEDMMVRYIGGEIGGLEEEKEERKE